MTGDGYFPRQEIVIMRTVMKGRIAKKNAWGGARQQFVRCGEMRVVKTIKHAKVGVGRVTFLEAKEKGVVFNGGGWYDV